MMVRLRADAPAVPAERGQHDPVLPESRWREEQNRLASEAAGKRVTPFGSGTVDAAGLVGDPYRVIDPLLALYRRGAIGRDELMAGQAFRDDFDRGALHPVRASDPSRPFVSGGGQTALLAVVSEAARARVHRAIRKVGGGNSLCGLCLWSVVGEGLSYREWVDSLITSNRSVTRQEAPGVLIAALARLVGK